MFDLFDNSFDEYNFNSTGGSNSNGSKTFDFLTTTDFGGAFGVITNFDGFVEGLGLGSLFGHSSPDEFAAAGYKLKGILDDLESKFSNNIPTALTEMSKAINYMELYYTAHLKGSRSTRAKTGNKDGFDKVKALKKNFIAKSKKAVSKFNLSVKEVSHTFTDNYLHSYGVDRYNGNTKGKYLQFENKSFVTGVPNSSKDLSGTKKGSSLIMAFVLGVIALFVIKK